MSVWGVTRTGASASYSVTSTGGETPWGQTIVASRTSGGSAAATISSNSGTFSGLSANTTYYVRGWATNSGGTGYTNETTFTTTGNAPTVTTSASRSRYGATISYNATYDTNASYSSRLIEYGTTTSYGSTTTSTTLSGLSTNTTYYYRVNITDNFGRTGSATGSFTTGGANPVITNVTANPLYNYCELSATVSYGESATFGSVTIRYGKTTSYGSTATSWDLMELDSKQTYYYSVVVTDNFGQSSAAYTGSFITLSSAPWDVSSYATYVTDTKAGLGMMYTVANPDYVTAASMRVTGTGYDVSKNLVLTSPNPLEFTGLTPKASYTIAGSVTNSTGTTSAPSNSFTAEKVQPNITAASVVTSGTTAIDVSITAAGGSGDTLQYRFSLGGGTWSALQTGSTYSFTNLTAGNTYTVFYEVRNGNQFIVENYTITTPSSGSTVNHGIKQYKQTGW